MRQRTCRRRSWRGVGARWCPRWLRWVAPSAATIRRVVLDVDADHLDQVVYRWLRERSGWDTRDQQREWLLALDGKVVHRREPARRRGEAVLPRSCTGRPPSSGRSGVPAGTNETTQVRPLLTAWT